MEEEKKEITLKFSKKLVGEPFKAKDGNEYREVAIPNKDMEDKSPWAHFVVIASRIHEDQFGSGMWTKMLEDGYTTISKKQLVGKNQSGKDEYVTNKIQVSNIELKNMIDAYKEAYREANKEKESLAEKLANKKEEVNKQKEKAPSKKAKEKDAR